MATDGAKSSHTAKRSFPADAPPPPPPPPTPPPKASTGLPGTFGLQTSFFPSGLKAPPSVAILAQAICCYALPSSHDDEVTPHGALRPLCHSRPRSCNRCAVDRTSCRCSTHCRGLALSVRHQESRQAERGSNGRSTPGPKLPGISSHIIWSAQCCGKLSRRLPSTWRRR